MGLKVESTKDSVGECTIERRESKRAKDRGLGISPC